MKVVFFSLVILYFGALAYIYLTQNMQIFNYTFIKKVEPFKLANMQNISLHVDEDVELFGVYKTSEIKDAPLIIYFGGNSDDATRILLHVKGLNDFDIVSFNYRGYVKSTGEPSEKALFADALKIYDAFAKDKKVILIGRSLGSGVATYLASKRRVAGVILITPYDSISSMAKAKYPIFPIDLLLKHKFESIKHVLHVKAPVGLIEVKDDDVVSKEHFDKLKQKVPNLSLHVELEDTTHGEVLTHPLFEESLKKIIESF
jgi:pimeloyl-ACP methyl ester carboxylesterase